jgi:hypothetical protein
MVAVEIQVMLAQSTPEAVAAHLITAQADLADLVL